MTRTLRAGSSLSASSSVVVGRPRVCAAGAFLADPSLPFFAEADRVFGVDGVGCGSTLEDARRLRLRSSGLSGGGGLSGGEPRSRSVGAPFSRLHFSRSSAHSMHTRGCIRCALRAICAWQRRLRQRHQLQRGCETSAYDGHRSIEDVPGVRVASATHPRPPARPRRLQARWSCVRAPCPCEQPYAPGRVVAAGLAVVPLRPVLPHPLFAWSVVACLAAVAVHPNNSPARRCAHLSSPELVTDTSRACASSWSTSLRVAMAGADRSSSGGATPPATGGAADAAVFGFGGAVVLRIELRELRDAGRRPFCDELEPATGDMEVGR